MERAGSSRHRRAGREADDAGAEESNLFDWWGASRARVTIPPLRDLTPEPKQKLWIIATVPPVTAIRTHRVISLSLSEESHTSVGYERKFMGNQTDLAPRSKSLADILAEELDGELGDEQTQELSVAEKQARLKAVYERIHHEQPARAALCLSGGGIRSAIFGLGILQGLAKTGLLGAFDYLSTVSGGGYVGGWLTRSRRLFSSCFCRSLSRGLCS